MDYIFALTGIVSMIFGVLFFCWLMYNFLYFLLPHRTANEFRKLKREFKAGKAHVHFGPGSQVCHTCCTFSYSSGKFSTTLDPVSSPFGVYEVRECSLIDADLINLDKLSVKAHDWAQRILDK